MKKSAIILSALLLCVASAWSQKINYEGSLEKAEKRSREENKILCILVTMPPPAYVPEVLTALKDPRITAKFNEHFVNYKIDRTDSASVPIIKKYNLTGFPVFVFIDSKGGLIFKKIGNMPPPMISNMIEQAVEESKGRSIIDYDRQYATGDRSNTFLKEYINKRINTGFTNNADLIEEYVNTIYVRDLNNYGEALFILKAGPIADGRAYALINTNRKMVDSIFRRELFDVRVAINNRIIENTMASAIANKNRNRAFAAVTHTRNSWNNEDWNQGSRNADRKMLQYFSGIKDTAGYLRHAALHYDRYYMNISADSIRKLNEKNEQRARSNAHEQAVLGMPPGAAIRAVGYAFAANNFAMELNNGAWSVYATRTKNTIYLTKAMLWAKRSVELEAASFNYDTLAHLQYRLGLYAEAENTQQKAIELARTEKRDSKKMQDELEKIKKRIL